MVEAIGNLTVLSLFLLTITFFGILGPVGLLALIPVMLMVGDLGRSSPEMEQRAREDKEYQDDIARVLAIKELEKIRKELSK